MERDFIRFEHIRKTFAGTIALDDVSLSIRLGECHCLMGENGAGKSTLGKILAGILRPDDGRVWINGVAHTFRSPADALGAGIGMVHQELAFAPDLSIAENLCMGTYPTRFARMFINRRAMSRRASELLSRIGVTTLDVGLPMRSLNTAQEQLVQIAAAVGTGARVIVFDEPTSSLSEEDTRRLLNLIDRLKARGATIVYVSHRMPEVFRLADRVSVLRDGRCVGTLRREEASADRVVQMMIGRDVATFFPQHRSRPRGDVRLCVKGLSSPGRFADISFDVASGEIVGLAGLVGSGRSEVAQAIFGLDAAATGVVTVDRTPLTLGSVVRAKQRGIGMLPEDRKRQGLVLEMSCLENFTLSLLDRLGQFGFLKRSTSRREASAMFQQLSVKTPSVDAAVKTLSGGNQQKIALAKWLGRACRVLILDEPTRGVDIGAKAAIHQLIDKLASSGMAIVMISSELPELINLTSRVLVMRDGRIVSELSSTDLTQDALLRHMTGSATT